MRHFDEIGKQAHRLAEAANNLHNDIQNVDPAIVDKEQEREFKRQIDEILEQVEDIREELAQLATDLGSTSLHDGRLQNGGYL